MEIMTSSNLTVEDLASVCRCCLTKDGELVSIYAACVGMMINSISAIELEEGDGYPENVCKNCIRKISATYCFLTLIRSSEETIRSILQNSQAETNNVEEINSFQSGPNPSHEDFANTANKQTLLKDPNIILYCERPYTSENNVINDNDKVKVEYIVETPLHYNDDFYDDKTIVVTNSEYISANNEIISQEILKEQNEYDMDVNEATYNMNKNIFLNQQMLNPSNDEQLHKEIKIEFIKTENDQGKVTHSVQNEIKQNDRKKVKRIGSVNKAKNVNYPQVTKIEVLKDDDLYELPHTNQNINSTEKDKPKGKKVRISKKQEMHLCSHCGKDFKWRTSLTRHARVHKGRCLSCYICDKLFPSKSDLKKHELTHRGVKKHECDVCHQKFSQTSSLNIHKKIHLNKKVHTCTVCQKQFVQKSTLTSHMLTHTKETPFQCEYCDRAFTWKRSYVVHLLSHKNDIRRKIVD